MRAAFRIFVQMLVLVATLLGSTRARADAGCTALTQYRDTVLIEDWNRLLQWRQGVVEARAADQQLKENLHSVDWWLLSSVPDIALAIKSVANLVKGVLESTPGVGSAGAAAAGAVARLIAQPSSQGAVAHLIDVALTRGEQAGYMVSEQFGELAWAAGTELTGPLGAAADTLKTTAENLHRMASLQEEKEGYRQTLMEATQKIDLYLSRWDAKLGALIDQQTFLNEMRAAIDRRCSSSEGMTAANDDWSALQASSPIEDAAPGFDHTVVARPVVEPLSPPQPFLRPPVSAEQAAALCAQAIDICNRSYNGCTAAREVIRAKGIDCAGLAARNAPGDSTGLSGAPHRAASGPAARMCKSDVAGGPAYVPCN